MKNNSIKCALKKTFALLMCMLMVAAPFATLALYAAEASAMAEDIKGHRVKIEWKSGTATDANGIAEAQYSSTVTAVISVVGTPAYEGETVTVSARTFDISAKAYYTDAAGKQQKYEYTADAIDNKEIAVGSSYEMKISISGQKTFRNTNGKAPVDDMYVYTDTANTKQFGVRITHVGENAVIEKSTVRAYIGVGAAGQLRATMKNGSYEYEGSANVYTSTDFYATDKSVFENYSSTTYNLYEKKTATFLFNQTPKQVITGNSSRLGDIFDYYPETEIYYTGTMNIGGYYNYAAGCFDFKVYEGSNRVFYGGRDGTCKNFESEPFKIQWFFGKCSKGNAFSDYYDNPTNSIIQFGAERGGYSYFSKYSGSGSIKLTLYNKASQYNKKLTNIKMVSTLVDSTAPQLEGYFVDNSIVYGYKDGGSSDVIYLTAKFSEPVQVYNLSDDKKNVYINTKVGGKDLRFYYDSGSGTDSLVFKAVLSDEYVGDSIVISKNALSTSDGIKQAVICDFMYNTSNQHNSAQTKLSSDVTLSCKIDTRTPKLRSTSEAVSAYKKEHTVGVMVSNMSTDGNITYKWSAVDNADGAGLNSWSTLKNYSATAENKISGAGFNGQMYLHVRAESVAGNRASATYGPYNFDNTAPVISAPNYDAYSRYQQTQTVRISLNDEHGTAVKKIYAFIVDKDNEYIEGWQERLVYLSDDEASSKMKSEGTGYSMSLSCIGSTADIKLPPEGFGSYQIGFKAEDKLGNLSSDITWISSEVRFDSRDTYAIEHTSNVEADKSLKDVAVYRASSESECVEVTVTSVGQNVSGQSYKLYSIKLDGAAVYTKKDGWTGGKSFGDYGFSADPSTSASELNKEMKATLGFKPQTNGWYEVVYEVNGSKQSQVASFYVSASDAIPTNYSSIYDDTRLLINKVWKLTTPTYYSHKNDMITSAYDSVASGAAVPIFSSPAKAYEYAKYMELQDISVLHITDTTMAEDLNGGLYAEFRKAPGEQKRAEVGQTWLCYKSISWTPTSSGRAERSSWVYYYYTESKVTAISEDLLSDELVAAIEDNAVEIAGVEKIGTTVSAGRRDYTYLTKNNGGTDAFGQPTYRKTAVFYDSEETMGCFSAPIKYSGDTEIYSSYIENAKKYFGSDVPDKLALIANYTFTLPTGYHKLYYRLASSESGTWYPVANGQKIKDIITATGRYEFAEISNGYKVYQVYCDISAPTLYYTAKRGEVEINNIFTQALDGGASSFNTVMLKLNKVLTPSTYSEGDVGVTEYDEYAYVYFSAPAFGSAKNLFFSLEDFKNGAITVPDGDYQEMLICDRLGNIIERAPVRINKKLPMAQDGSAVDKTDQKITFTFTCKPDEVEEFYIRQGAEIRADAYIDTEYSYYEAGNYTYYIRDIYGNVATDTVEFVRTLPEVVFEYKVPDSNRYAEMVPTDASDGVTAGSTSVVGAVCEKIGISTYHITSSSDIRIGYLNSERYGIRQIKPENTSALYSTGISNMKYSYWNIPMSGVEWEIQIYHLNDPGTYITISCINDNTPPEITAVASLPDYEFLESGMTGDVGYQKLDPIEEEIGDGKSVDADKVTFTWSDRSSIVSVYYTFNGGEIINVDRSSEAFNNKTITFSERGTYALTVIDALNNTAKFTITLKHVPLNASMSVGGENVELSEAVDKSGMGTPTEIKTGKSMQITLRENTDLTFSWLKKIPGIDDTQTSIYQLHYVSGRILISAGLADDEFYYDAVNKDADGNGIYFELAVTGEQPAELFANGDLVIKYTFTKGSADAPDVLTLYFENLTVEPQHWKIRLTDTQGMRPMLVSVVSSTVKPNMQLTDSDGKVIETKPDAIVGANKELALTAPETAADGLLESLEAIKVYYSETVLALDEFEQKAKYYEIFDKEKKQITDTLSKEGYYKIVIVNQYGNEQQMYVRLSFGLVIDIELEYEDGDSRKYQFKEPTQYGFNTNGSFGVTVWYQNVTVSVLRGGEVYSITPTGDSSSKRFTLHQAGEYEVTIKDDCNNIYSFTVSVKEKQGIAYNGYLTGFNKDAIRLEDGYTNDALSLDKEKIEADGISYVAYRLKGESAWTVLYDLISQESVAYNESNFVKSIGKQNGNYEVLFTDAYGNEAIKEVHISNQAQLSISRHTQASTKEDMLDIKKVIADGAWSNYTVTLVNSAKQYKLLVNGKTEDTPFNENGKRVFKLSPGLGEAREKYTVCYIDEYGNKYEFVVNLYRKTPAITQNVNGELINADGSIYIKGDVSYTWSGDGIAATYVNENGETVEYVKGSSINKDGLYQMMFTDIAGNISNIIVTRDTTVKYELIYGAEAVPSGISVSGAITVKPVGERLTIVEAVRDGVLLEGEALSFSTHGFYRVMIADKVGNIAQLEFDIINHPMQSFTYTAHSGFAISQVFFNMDGQKLSYAAAISTDEAGSYCYAFDADGSYDIELWHMENDEYYTFHVDIDNVAPNATVVGVSNGGATRENIKLAGLVSGDIVEIWRDGVLISTTEIKRDGESPEISEPGQYTVIIKDLAGNFISYSFVREYTTNAAANAMVCLSLVGTSAGGVVFLRGRGKIRIK